MANALVVHKDRLPQSQQMHRAAQYVRMSTDGDVPGSVEFLKRSALPTLSR